MLRNCACLVIAHMVACALQPCKYLWELYDAERARPTTRNVVVWYHFFEANVFFSVRVVGNQAQAVARRM